jgi:RNA-directed DNA polymerase
MTTEPSVGAASHADTHWHATDWRAVQQSVRRLQARIVKATQEGRWGKVRALQHLLTHSFSGKALAVRRVTENQGKRTPGVDKVVWDTPEKKAQAVRDLKRRGYRPLPLRRVLIPKSNGRVRPLGIPAMKDRAMQALHLLALDPVAETVADPNSYGFRKARSCADAIEQCFTALCHANPQWVLEGDIKSCFDNLSHEWLLAHVPVDRVILRRWLKSGYMAGQVLYETEDGTPQGGVISPVLANLALDGLERRLREQYPAKGKGSERGRLAGVHLIRYADDFIITGRTRELLEGEVRPLVASFLAERGLELSPEKTRLTHVTDGFDFLGQHVRKYANGKLLIKPSKKNVKSFLDDVRGVVRRATPQTAAELIRQLNPKIRGWANYHRHVVSKRIFSRVDCAIFEAVWQWARRRHNRKGRRWLKQRYFCRRRGRDWCFFGESKDEEGRACRAWLHHATRTPIRRHVKVRGAANPYDPRWEEYFERREGVKMLSNLRGVRQLRYLWHEQNGLCPVCGEKITKLTGWHNHHLVYRVMGGPDSAENRVLLHPECHRSVHSRKLFVEKPRPAKGV